MKASDAGMLAVPSVVILAVAVVATVPGVSAGVADRSCGDFACGMVLEHVQLLNREPNGSSFICFLSQLSNNRHN